MSQEKYKKIFMDVFSLKEDQFQNNIEYNAISEWDSIGHMTMIAEMENVFGIMMETDDVMDFNSYAKGIEILKKYGITV